MQPWIWIVIGIISFLLIAYVVAILIIGRILFFRIKEEELLINVPNLENTHYKPYVDIVKQNMESFMQVKYEEVSVTSFDNLKLYGKYYNNNSDKTIIFFHGYHADPYNNSFLIGPKLLEEGYNLLLITHRAHGKSGGKYITFGYNEMKDGLEWVKFINDNYKPKAIGLWGVSMGCATIEMMSDKLPDNCRAMVLDCGFTGNYEEILYSLHNKINFIPEVIFFGLKIYARIIGHFKLEKSMAIEALKNTKIPAYFIHGKEDKMVPYSMGLANYEACGSTKELLSTDCGHAISHLHSKDEIDRLIYPFLKMYLDI